jgi:hypothetical protein
VKVGEKELAVLHPLQVSSDRLLDLDDHLGLVVDGIGVREDLRSGRLVLGIGEPAAVSCPGLDEDGVSVRGEVLDARGRHPYAIFVVFDFGRYADPHC